MVNGLGWAYFPLLLFFFWVIVNVNKIKDFGEAAKREILSDRHAFETARRLSHDNMEEKVPWVCPRPLVLPSPLVTPGSNSQERYIQAERKYSTVDLFGCSTCMHSRNG